MGVISEALERVVRREGQERRRAEALGERDSREFLREMEPAELRVEVPQTRELGSLRAG